MTAESFRCSDIEVPGPCSECGADEVCAPINDTPRCNDCWHRARQATQAYMAVRVDTPEHVEKYGRYFAGIPGTLEEATEFAREMERRSGGRETYETAPVSWYAGGRRAHPGYMSRRRGAILAAHPEYK